MEKEKYLKETLPQCREVKFPQKENSIFHDCILGDRRWGWSHQQKKDAQLSHNTCLCPPHPRKKNQLLETENFLLRKLSYEDNEVKDILDIGNYPII
jgi:hypothetical protein